MSDFIQCGCGAKINSSNLEAIKNFDATHSDPAHQSAVMQLKLMKAKDKHV